MYVHTLEPLLLMQLTMPSPLTVHAFPHIIDNVASSSVHSLIAFRAVNRSFRRRIDAGLAATFADHWSAVHPETALDVPTSCYVSGSGSRWVVSAFQVTPAKPGGCIGVGLSTAYADTAGGIQREDVALWKYSGDTHPCSCPATECRWVRDDKRVVEPGLSLVLQRGTSAESPLEWSKRWRNLTDCVVQTEQLECQCCISPFLFD